MSSELEPRPRRQDGPPPPADAASLSASSAESKRLQVMRQVADEVYGPYHPPASARPAAPESSENAESQQSVSVSVWKPRPYIEGHKGRYLWTDAYGVCNFLTLYCETKNARFLEQAEALVRDVHHTLGRTRDGRRRLGRATEERPLLGTDRRRWRGGFGRSAHTRVHEVCVPTVQTRMHVSRICPCICIRTSHCVLLCVFFVWRGVVWCGVVWCGVV